MSNLFNLMDTLKSSVNETSVQFAYWSVFKQYYAEDIIPSHNTDGILMTDDISVLMECKYQIDFKNEKSIYEVLLQSLFYLKKLKHSGAALPKSIFIGDKVKCGCVPVDINLTKYLLYDIDWDIAASSSSTSNSDMVLKLFKDKSIIFYMFNIDSNFNFDSVIERLRMIASGDSYLIDVNEHNMALVFNDFLSENIITDSLYNQPKESDIVIFNISDNIEPGKKNVRKLSDLFIDCFISPTTCLHPNRKNILINNGIPVKVNSKKFEKFFSTYRISYSASALESLVANKDRILEEVYRRGTGSFFTPRIWVDEAHKEITSAFGETWKNDYIVWDCAAGTANLTREYLFNKLYISTLEQADIDNINDMKYNPSSIKFQYDFLSEIGIDNCPNELKKAMEEKKKLLVFINPPYGKSGGNLMGSISITDVDSIIKHDMRENNLGKYSSQLFSQFVYKIIKLKEINENISLVIFCQSSLISSSHYEKFRSFITKRFNYISGFWMRSNNFSDVSDGSISLTIWS